MTYQEIYDTQIADFCNRQGIPVEDAGLVVIAIIKTWSAGLYQLSKIIDGLANNYWVGSMQASKLIEVGTDKIGRAPYGATSGEYTCSTVANGVGNIPDKSQFTIELNGVTYVFESLAIVAGGDDIEIRALTAGTDALLTVGDVLTSKQNLEYASNEITVTAVDDEPNDDEPIEDYRAVVVAYERLRSGNGNASDYITWVANVNGLRTAYPYTAPNEAGKAVIYCESSDEEILIPGASLINDAIDSIKYDSDGISQPPVEFFEYITPSYVLPVQITGVKITLTGGDTSQQTVVEDLMRDYLLIKRPFLHTVNKLIQVSENYNTYENTIALVDIIQLLANSAIQFDAITMEVDVLLAGSYSTMSKYVVGYRGGSTYPTTLSPSNDPALSTYYGECPRLEQVTINS